MLKMNKKAVDLLTGNLIFIILAIVFIGILFLFVYSKSSSEALVEEQTAKQIALMIDAANPGTQIILNIEGVLEGNKAANPIRIGEGVVRVQLSEKSGYSYGFFNRVEVESQISGGNLILKIK